MALRSDTGVLRTVQWNFDVPLEAARCFVDDMRAYHAETIGPKRDEIAARQASLLSKHLPMRSRNLRSVEVAEVFELMKGK
jgi:hypothetical protein